MTSGVLTYISVAVSSILRTDFFRIHSVDGRCWHHLYLCPLLCHNWNRYRHDTFCQWQEVESLIPLSFFLSLIGRVLSGFAGSMEGGGITHYFFFFAIVRWFPFNVPTGWITYASVYFSVINWTDRFRIRSINGRRWIHLYLCLRFFHWSSGSFSKWVYSIIIRGIIVNLSSSLSLIE